MQLEEASIAELFAKEPTTWTDEDLKRTIEYFRTQRIALAEADAAGKRAPRTPTVKQKIDPAIAGLDEGIDL